MKSKVWTLWKRDVTVGYQTIDRDWKFNDLCWAINGVYATWWWNQNWKERSQMAQGMDFWKIFTFLKNFVKIRKKDNSITFKDVHFSYNGVDDVLKNINMNIEPTQKIGIVGRTGAGKSSLTTALFRLRELRKGKNIFFAVYWIKEDLVMLVL